jgi:sarcosine oxidase subunit gamma
MTKKGSGYMAKDLIHRGFVTVAPSAPMGMITLRGASVTLAPALSKAAGLDWPAQRRIVTAGPRALAWMSPDEALLIVPPADVAHTITALASALAGQFATVADVSDARAAFTITGAGWRDALAKVCPVDFGTFEADEIRRTRAAQVAVAVWQSAPDQATLVCFRSVAEYVYALLCTAAAPGSAPGLYR